MSQPSGRHRLGFGTCSLTGDEGADVVETALEAGYRHLDTARLCGNESAVGEAPARSRVPREEVFVATEVAHSEEPGPTPAYVRGAVAESRDRLGVSNYTVPDLDRAGEILDTPVLANQVEFHPLLYQSELLAAVCERDVALVAHSPVAQGAVLEEPTLVDVADKHGATPAQVSPAGVLSKPGVAAIPRTSDPGHVRENLAAREVRLDATDTERIDAIGRETRLEDPDWMEW